MNKYFKTIATAMVTFSMLLSLVATPASVLAVSSDFGFSTEGSGDFGSDFGSGFGDSDFSFENQEEYDNEETNNASSDGSSASVVSGTYTKCAFSSDSYEIFVGGSVRLSWDTKGFDTLTLDGVELSADAGYKVFSDIRENTRYILEGKNSNGDDCLAEVYINCLPPEVPEYCELDIHKTVDKQNAVIGEDVTYTITVKNTGDADCTGGGVKIYDEVDPNLVYKNNTLTGNLSAGYGNKPVYTNSDRTLRFNGHELTPNESGTITWTGTVAAPTQCGDFEVKNQAKATAKELNNFNNWVYSQTVKTQIDNDCDEPEVPVKPQCPYTAADGTVVDFGDARLFSSRGDVQAQTVPNAVNLAAGDYSVRLVAWDGYTNRVNVSQPNEKYRVVFANDSAVVAESNDTDDLADNVISALFDAQVNSKITLSSDVNNVFALHSVFPDNSSPNSVNPICAVFTPLEEEEQKATIVAHKIVCTDEAELPNYGNGGPNMTANTAADWVAANSSCSLVAGWEFEWTDNQGSDPGDTLVGKAGSPWTSFGPTNTNGDTTTVIDLNTLSNDRVWFREVLQDGYIPFTHGQNAGTNVDDVSAEFYCNSDVVNYDNRDFIAGMENGKTYHCVAWNSLVPEVPAPSCDLFTATPETITVGDTATLAWETSNATAVFLNNGFAEVEVDGSREVTPLETTEYILTVMGADDKEVDCKKTVTVSEDKVPVCEFFTATPDALPVGGGDVTLAWKVTDAVSVSIAPTIGAVLLEDTTSVNVTEGTTYVLTAVDDNGDEVTCPAPVAVADPEPVFTCEDSVNFSASDSSITRGQDTELTWSTTNVDTVSISVINATSLSGNQTVSPSVDTTYTLTATQGNKTVNCPVSVDVSSGGGGGGSSSPRCDLDISDSRITLGEEITISWDTSRATEVTLSDDEGEVLFTTDDYLSDEKEDFFDGSITLRPTQDTQYTLLAERGSRDEECSVEVEVENTVVVLETRDQQPLVAGISLSQVPHTGFEAGPLMTYLFYILLGAWSLFVTYLLVMRNKVVPVGVSVATVTDRKEENVSAMKQAEAIRPDVFTPSVMTKVVESQTVPVNLPTGIAVAGQDVMKTQEVNTNPHQVGDALVTELEDRAHAQKALLSSDSVRYFIATTEGSVERNEALDQVISEAKKSYPLEDGWVVMNEARMQSLCEVCQVNSDTREDIPFVPSTVPEGTGSLAEAIVTGNVVAAYEMIGNRPMFALADASADLDAVYRNRRGATEKVSALLTSETKNLSDEQITEMISALTGALDGTYTDEASAVKMSIMKAVKVLA